MGWPFGLALVAAVGLGALAAFLPALALGRAPGFTTAIATIALIFIAQTVIRNIPGLGGATGLFHIPPVEYLLIVEYVAVIVVGIFIHRLEHSKMGGAMGITFVGRDIAASLGIDAYKLSVFLQVFAGALGALAGVFYAFAVSIIRVSHFGFSLLLSVYAFLFVGGSRTMWGPVVFTPILWALTVFLPRGVAEWKDIIFGALLVIVLVFRPNGVIDRKLMREINIKGQNLVSMLTGSRKAKVLN
jgi:branched-chain amino acid transport system permease protein